MDVIEHIERRLADYPQLQYEREPDALTIQPPSDRGFEVWVAREGPGWIVGFDGWHEHLADADEALECFAFGMSDQARLKVYMRGRFEYKWTLQHRQDGQWRDDSTTGLLIFPYWRRVHIEYRQNAIIETAGE